MTVRPRSSIFRVSSQATLRRVAGVAASLTLFAFAHVAGVR